MQDEEEFFNEFYEQFPTDFDRPRLREKLARWVWEKVSQAWADGYNKGVSDTETAIDRMD